MNTDTMVVLGVAAALFAVVEMAAVTGLFAAAAGERVERCARCQRFGLTAGGVVHRDGCPQHMSAHLPGVHRGIRPHHPMGLGR